MDNAEYFNLPGPGAFVEPCLGKGGVGGPCGYISSISTGADAVLTLPPAAGIPSTIGIVSTLDTVAIQQSKPPLPPKTVAVNTSYRHSSDLSNSNREFNRDLTNGNTTNCHNGLLVTNFDCGSSSSGSSSIDNNCNESVEKISSPNGSKEERKVPRLILDSAEETRDSSCRSSSSPDRYSSRKYSSESGRFSLGDSPDRKLSESPDRKYSGVSLERKLSTGSDIADKVYKFEALATTPTTPSADNNKGLWFYKDGLRSPSTPPPTASRLVLSVMKDDSILIPTKLDPSTMFIQAKPESSLPHPPFSFIQTKPESSLPQKRNSKDLHSTFNSTAKITLSTDNSPSIEQQIKACMTASMPSILSPSSPHNSSSFYTPRRSFLSGLPPALPAKTLVSPRNLATKPPALPPKQCPPKPPPRPQSKELKLDDILSMCAEYERQIETEQRESAALSPTPSFAEQERQLSESTPSQVENDFVQTLQLSPNSTLQQPRIKTNGSLSRDGKRLPSPSRSLPPPSPATLNTSEAELSGIFSFTLPQIPGSPGGTFPRVAGFSTTTRSPYENMNGSSPSTSVQVSQNSTPTSSTYLTHPSPASPRTRIKTTVGRGSVSSRDSSSETLKGTLDNGSTNGSPAHTLNNKPPTYFSLADYQGGKESISDCNGKSKEELYIDAKELLGLVGGGSPAESPSSTGPRRPPRSKHDVINSNNMTNGSDVMPSSEAVNRMLIGTVMLSANRNVKSPDYIKSPTSSLPSIQSPLVSSKPGVVTSPDIEQFEEQLRQAELLRCERREAVMKVSSTSRKVAELDWAVEEANRSLDLESSLLGAEIVGAQLEVEELEEELRMLREKEEELVRTLEAWRAKSRVEIEEAKNRLVESETDLEKLEDEQKDTLGSLDTDAELKLLEKLKHSHERLEAERRIFEDLEFRHMEEEARLEADVEEVGHKVAESRKLFEEAKDGIQDVEQQQMQLSVTTEKDVAAIADTRSKASKQLEEERQKLTDLERKLSQLMQTAPKTDWRSDEDSGTITASDEDLSQEIPPPIQPRLSIISNPRVSILSSNYPSIPTRVSTVSIRSQGWKRDNMNSAGSDVESSESTSDLPADSSSNSPSPVQKNRKVSRRQQRENINDKLDTSADESRPMSTDSTSWVDGGGVVVRRNAGSRAGQRPLTRYLPVTTQEDFDLRGHIETAGHQIELCRHIVLNSGACRGYLSKLGARFKSWNKRWFVFDRNKRTLVYYADKSEVKAKGGIYFHSIEEVYVDHQTNVKTSNSRVTFCMKTSERKYYLMAPSPEAMRIWVDVIFTGAEGYQEFQNDQSMENYPPYS